MTPADKPDGGTGQDAPPWQRVGDASGNGARWSSDQADTGAAGVLGRQDQVDPAEQTVVTGTAANRLFAGDPAQTGETAPHGAAQTEPRQQPSGVGSGKSRSAPSALRRPGRGPRRASLQVKRFDPWSVLKLALVFGVALFFIWLVAVGVLYTVLDGMGVWDKLNGTYSQLVQGEGDQAAAEPLISAGRVFGVAAIVGAINIVLMSALATISAFIYNVCADLAGGLEVTLSERE